MTPAQAILLRGSAPLVFGEGGAAWRVEAGAVAVWYTELENGEPAGHRTFIFEAQPGDILEGAREAGRGWMAVAIRETRLVTCPRGGGGWQRKVAAAVGQAFMPGAGSESALAAGASVGETAAEASLLAGAASVGEPLTEASLLAAAAQLEARRRERNRTRFEERGALDHRLASASLQELLSAGGRTSAAAAAAGTGNLLADAVRALGAAHHFTVREPAAESVRRDSITAIALASGVRTRRVALAGRWWHSEHGPMIAFRAQERTPVALLPEPAGIFTRAGYRLYDPSTGEWRHVDGAEAARLERDAHLFYPPLDADTRTLPLLRAAFAPFRRDLLVAVICGAGATLVGMAAPAAMSILLARAIPSADSAMMTQVALGLAVSLAGTALFEIAQSFALLRVLSGMAAALQTGVQDRLLRLKPGFFRRHTAGELHIRAEGVTQIQQSLDPARVRMLVAGVASCLNLFLMLIYSVPLALGALACAAVMVGTMAWGSRAVLRLERARQEAAGALHGLMVQIIKAVGKLRVAGAEARAHAHWARGYATAQRLDSEIRRAQDFIRMAGSAMPLVATALAFWMGLARDGAPRAGLGMFLGFLVAQSVFLSAVAGLNDAVTGLLGAGTRWARMRGILEAEPEVASGRIHPGQLEGRVDVAHVSFRYRADGPLTLNDVSFHAEPGECIALVGPSGSGKSTLLNLILRFETPASGAIYIDGKDIAGLDVAAMRRQMGVVAQESRLMAQSIYENIVCGGLCTMDEALEAARMAGIADDIERMPMGMHTLVSEDGGNLSGGQRQRLLIARALVRKPRIFLFDEATSALDNRTQRIVTESLNRLRATRIVVAHRLSTIREADRIYVIDNGCVVQHGSFEELAGQAGVFAELMSRQFAGGPGTAA